MNNEVKMATTTVFLQHPLLDRQKYVFPSRRTMNTFIAICEGKKNGLQPEGRNQK